MERENRGQEVKSAVEERLTALFQEDRLSPDPERCRNVLGMIEERTSTPGRSRRAFRAFLPETAWGKGVAVGFALFVAAFLGVVYYSVLGPDQVTAGRSENELIAFSDEGLDAETMPDGEETDSLFDLDLGDAVPLALTQLPQQDMDQMLSRLEAAVGTGTR